MGLEEHGLKKQKLPLYNCFWYVLLILYEQSRKIHLCYCKKEFGPNETIKNIYCLNTV